MKNTLLLIGCVAFTFIVGSSGGLFTVSEIPNWYATINKPSFNPPNWIFGPVWTILYALMGYALFLIFKQPNSTLKINALIIFFVQFTLNFFWSIIFFKLHALGWAFVEIIAMWIFILLNIIWFYKLNKIAAYVLIPYLLWVSFASLLNYSIWQLNS